MAIASPKPTAAPGPQVVAQRLRERQFGQTCGWIDANLASPITCAAGLTCAYNALDSVRWCCEDLDLCDIPTACVNAASVTADCNNICLENSFILKCTTAGYPFCYTRFWNEGGDVSELGCVAFPQSVTLTAESTYFGEVVVTTPAITLTTPSPNPTSQSSTSSSSTTSNSRSSSSTSSSSTSASSTSPSTVSTSPESTGGDLALGIAAIVGIVIGVIFFCILLCGAGFFCWRAAKRRRNRRRLQPPATTLPIDTSQVPPVYNTYNQPPATTVPIDTNQVPPVYNISNISPIKPTTVVSQIETPEPSPENSVPQTASAAVVTQPGTAVEPPASPHRIDDGVSSQPSGYEDLFPEDLDRGLVGGFGTRGFPGD